MNEYEAKQEAKRAGLQAAADRAEGEADRRYGTAKGLLHQIPPGQPILVGHHSEKRHRAHLAKVDTNMRKAGEATDRAEHLRSRADAVGRGGISSDDPDALVKLREKLAGLEAKHAQDKKVSAAWRKAKGPASTNREGWEKVAEIMGVKLEHLADYIRDCHREESYGMARGPVPPYVLSNRNGNMKRIRGRIAGMEQREKVREVLEAEGQEVQETEHDGFKIEEDHLGNRLRIFFDAKPASDVRKNLKSHGFRWSPNAGAWQRQLTNAARLSAKMALGLPLNGD